MSQISPPIRILLVAVIGLCAAYMLFLRPKDEAVAPAAPAAATTPVPAKDPNAKTNSKPGAAVQQAVRGGNNAAARADQAAGGAIGETESGAVPGSSTPASSGVNTNPVAQAPATGQTSAPAAVTKEQLRSLPRDVRKAVLKRKVLVLLFYNNRSYDDRAVRRELAHLSHHGKQVFVDAHWIKNVARFQAITRGVDVEQSPTIVVADANLKAETLVGYVDRDTIDQMVVDAIRASGGSLIKNPYFRQLDAICTSAQLQTKALQQPASAAAVPAYLVGLQGITNDVEKKVAGVKAPKKWAKFDKAFKVYAAGQVGLANWAVTHAKTEGTGAFRAVAKQGKKMDKKFVQKHGAHGLSCF